MREYLKEMRTRGFPFYLGIFVLLNVFLYFFIIVFHNLIPFNKDNYIHSSHHYFEDPRFVGGNFNLLRALGQYDAQWYLGIASDGYPAHMMRLDESSEGESEILSYAFFPLYPLVVGAFKNVLGGVELSAFIVSNILLLLNFCSLYYAVSKIFNKNVAIKTCFLLFLFPFSIFFAVILLKGYFYFCSSGFAITFSNVIFYLLLLFWDF